MPRKRRKKEASFSKRKIILLVGALVGAAVLLLFLAVFFILPGPGEPPNTNSQNAGEIRQAPDFNLSDYNGVPFSLSALRGKKVLLVFFSAASPAGQEGAPLLLEAVSKNPGTLLVHVNAAREDAAVLYEFSQKWGLAGTPVLLDLDLKVARLYSVSGSSLPAIFLISSEGTIVQAYSGKLSAIELEKILS
jgi:peroxiredoxin Q/BCP